MGLKGSMSLGRKEEPCKIKGNNSRKKKSGNYHDLKGIINRPQKTEQKG